jgi:hypothetical protein
MLGNGIWDMGYGIWDMGLWDYGIMGYGISGSPERMILGVAGKNHPFGGREVWE